MVFGAINEVLGAAELILSKLLSEVITMILIQLVTRIKI
jgi:hypothetical protein